MSLGLAILPMTIAAAHLLRTEDAASSFLDSQELAIRAAMLAAALHLAPTLGEELESQTNTYLWTRPLSRSAFLIGKFLALAPRLLLLFGGSVALTYVISMGGSAGAHLALLARAEGASAAAVFSTGALAMGLGAARPKNPLVWSLLYTLLVDQLLELVPTINYGSLSHHLDTILGTAGTVLGKPPTIGDAVISLVIMSALWLGIGFWRLNVAEHGISER